MKKLFKGIVGIASLAAVAAGIYYVAQKWFDEKDEELEDDFDDVDFDDEEDSREYVTLDIDNPEEESTEESGEESIEETPQDVKEMEDTTVNMDSE